MECLSFTKLAVPIAFSFLLDLLNSYAPLVIVGRGVGFTHNDLAAVALGNLVFNLGILSIAYGITSGLNTLLAQAHGAWEVSQAAAATAAAAATLEKESALEAPLLDEQRQRTSSSSFHQMLESNFESNFESNLRASSLRSHSGPGFIRWTVLLLCIAGVPLAALCLFSGQLLGLVGQPAAIAPRAGRYTVVLLCTCGVPSIMRTLQGKVLNTARAPWPAVLGIVLGTLANALTQLYFFYFQRDQWDARWPFPQLGWTRQDEAYLAAALGKAAYATAAAAVTGSYLILSRNVICPLGCCPTPGLCSGRHAAPESGERERYGGVQARGGDSAGGGAAGSDVAAEGGGGGGSGGGALRRKLANAAAVPCLVLSLAVPSMLMMIAEWWSFELLALFAGWLPTAQEPTIAVAANGVLFITNVVVYQIFKSLGIATGIRVANALGSGGGGGGGGSVRVRATSTHSRLSSVVDDDGNGGELLRRADDDEVLMLVLGESEGAMGRRASAARRARAAAWLGICTNALLGVLLAVLVGTAGRRFLPALVTHDARVEAVSRRAMPGAACAIFGFALLMTCLQIMQSSGRQRVATLITFGGYVRVQTKTSFTCWFF